MGWGWYYANVAVHVLAAILWLGGMFFLAVAAAPVLRTLDPPELRAQIFARLGERFRTVGWWAIVILIVTGTFNLHFRGVLRADLLGEAAFWSTPFGTALAWKLAAVTAMVIVSALHDFVQGPAASRMKAGSAQATKARRRAAWLARINALLGIIVVLAAVRLARGG